MHVARCCFTATKSINLRFSHHHSCHSTCLPDNMVGSDDRDGSEWLVAMLDGISWGCWVGWEDMGWVWIGLVKNDVDLGRVWLVGWWDAITQSGTACICVFVYLCPCVFGWVGDGMQRVGLQSHTGVVQAGGHTCCSGLTEVPCLMSTSSIGPCIRLASRSPPPATSHHILSRCTNCWQAKTTLPSEHCCVFKPLNTVMSSESACLLFCPSCWNQRSRYL